MSYSRKVEYNRGGGTSRTVERTDNDRRDSGGSNYNKRGRNDNYNDGDDNRRRNSYHGGGGDRRISGGRGNRQSNGERKTGGMVERQDQILPAEVLMAKQILSRLGDYSAMTEEDDLISNIKALAGLLVSLDDLTNFADEISDLFIQCFSQLSVQIPILSALLALVFKSNRIFPKLVVDKLTTKLLISIQKDDVQTSKLILRSMASLASSNCIILSGNDSFFNILETLNNITESSWIVPKNIPQGGENIPQSVLDYQGQVSAFLLAATIPWISTVFSPSTAGTTDLLESKNILTKIKNTLTRVCSEWISPYELGGPQAVFHIGIVHATDCKDGPDDMSESYVTGISPLGPKGATCWDTLYEACHIAVEIIDTLITDDAQFTTPSVMCCPWLELKDELEAIGEDPDSSLLPLGESNSLSTEIFALAKSGIIGSKSRLSLPNGSAQGSGSAQWLIPRFPIFDSETTPDCISCCLLSSLEKYTIMGYFRDILQFFDPYICPDGTRTGSTAVMTAHLMSVSKLLTKTSDDASPLHLEFMLLETIFQELLQQPSDPTTTSKLYRVVLDLSKENPVFAPAVAIGTGVLFNFLPEMDSTSARELCQWLSYHLNNSKLLWPYWTHWESDCESEGASKSFCASLIDHCTRSSLPERIKAAVPQAFHSMIPVDCIPLCALFQPLTGDDADYSTETDPSSLSAVAQQLRGMLDKREEADTVEEWLESIDPKSMIGELSFYSKEWRAQILFQAVLSAGGSSIPVLTRLTDRYLGPLRTLSLPVEEGSFEEEKSLKSDPYALMTTLLECLGHEPGFFNLALDVMLRRGVVSPAAAADWATSASVLESVHTSYWPHKHLEVVVDRTTDIVRAAVANRLELGGVMMMDETATMDAFLLVKASAVSTASVTDVATSGMEVEVELVIGERQTAEGEDEMDGEGEGDVRSRRRRDEDDLPDTDKVIEDEEDPVTIATEAVLLALEGSRTVYHTVVGRLLVALMRREQYLKDKEGDEEAEGSDERTVACQSLLLRALRAFHGVERGYAAAAGEGESSRVVLTSVALVDVELLQAERDGITDSSKNSAAVSNWKSFAYPALI